MQNQVHRIQTGREVGGVLNDHTSRGALGWGLSPQLLPLMGVIFFFLNTPFTAAPCLP